MERLIVYALLGLLMATAFTVVRLRSLFATAMLSGIYSFLGASWMLLLDAPDVAFTEAAVGAGISTVLFLATLALTTRLEKPPRHSRAIPLFVVTVTGAALIYGTLDMADYGDPTAPIHQHVAPKYLAESVEKTGVPNVVTAVLASYRGYDTLGEVTVIFTAAAGVLVLLGRARRRTRRDGGEGGAKETAKTAAGPGEAVE